MESAAIRGVVESAVSWRGRWYRGVRHWMDSSGKRVSKAEQAGKHRPGFCSMPPR